jgi:hypothetical protein
LVHSRIDYGSALKTHLQKIDTTSRSIMRIILGSKPSTPTKIIYAERVRNLSPTEETGWEPVTSSTLANTKVT